MLDPAMIMAGRSIDHAVNAIITVNCHYWEEGLPVLKSPHIFIGFWNAESQNIII